MKISVIIPAYNAASTIDAAIESVLAQTVAPDEILILDDGSTDETFRHLEAHQHRTTIFRQSNRGAAHARNQLVQRANSEIVAFLDADDIWHPKYLETQLSLLKKHPDVAASFTGHKTFRGCGSYSWEVAPENTPPESEILNPINFFEQYNSCPGPFGSMSFCCIPKRVLTQIGQEPFPVKLEGAEDFCLMNMLPLHGPVVHTKLELVAYRETAGSLSSNRLKVVGTAVKAFELLAENNRILNEQRYIKAFKMAFASKRRQYAKFLMGAGQATEARIQLRSSMANAGSFLSLAKSLGLLLSVYLPIPFQPRWPAQCRK
jgi:glycosyltransferase involved in cell wall biosynthesis